MGRLDRAACTLHSISAQTARKESNVPNIKVSLRSYDLNKYAVQMGKTDSSDWLKPVLKTQYGD